MITHHNTSPNSRVPYKNKDGINNIYQEIEMSERRFIYVQLMRDAHLSLGDQDANILIKDSEAIWYKLSNQKSVENEMSFCLDPNS